MAKKGIWFIAENEQGYWQLEASLLFTPQEGQVLPEKVVEEIQVSPLESWTVRVVPDGEGQAMLRALDGLDHLLASLGDPQTTMQLIIEEFINSVLKAGLKPK
jgi:hypothetical protein